MRNRREGEWAGSKGRWDKGRRVAWLESQEIAILSRSLFRCPVFRSCPFLAAPISPTSGWSSSKPRVWRTAVVDLVPAPIVRDFRRVVWLPRKRWPRPTATSSSASREATGNLFRAPHFRLNDVREKGRGRRQKRPDLGSGVSVLRCRHLRRPGGSGSGQLPGPPYAGRLAVGVAAFLLIGSSLTNRNKSNKDQK